MSSRAINDFANINSIGLIAAYSLIITFAKIYNKEFSWDILFSIPAAIITVASGSRKALLAVIIGISIIYFVKEVGKSLLFQSFLKNRFVKDIKFQKTLFQLSMMDYLMFLLTLKLIKIY